MGPYRPAVETASGAVRGRTSGRAFAFLGIPYGASTVGAARFAPPRPAAPWTGVRDAVEHGPSCPQISEIEAPGQSLTFRERLTGSTQVRPPGGEDCLVLNVWTTTLDPEARRPVMVWLHGGGFFTGSGSNPEYDGAALASRGDVVAVTVNHRLGALGFLHLEDVAGERFAGSGNAGMLDIVQALEWVRDNIAGFGGDPGCVTIYGNSGGGYKVRTLMAMPAARGLFHRAIVQSGVGAPLQSRHDATARARALLAQLDIEPSRATALDDVPIDRILAAQAAVVERSGGTVVGGLGFSPVVDGEIVVAEPEDALVRGLAPDVPLMVGTTRYEHTRFLAPTDPDFTTFDEATVRARLRGRLGARADDVFDAYRAIHPEAAPHDLLVLILTDHSVRMPSIRFAQRAAEFDTAPVFMYVLAWESPALGGTLRSLHGLCVPLAMDNPDRSPYTDASPRSRAMAARTSDAWISFARRGDPSHPGLPPWPAYCAADRATMVLDDESVLVGDPFGERELWEAAA